MGDYKTENLFRKYIERMKTLSSSGEGKSYYEELSDGKNTYLKMNRLESSSYDPAWIDKIEGVIFDLGDIIANPRTDTQVISDLTPIELAKKIKGESVQHLASHTQFIKEIDDYGNVIPSKILSFSNDDNLFTYENRFIATFVRKLLLFIEKRYEFAVKFATLQNQELLYIKNESTVDGGKVEIETKIKIVTDSQDEAAKSNNEYFARITEVREYIRYFYNSPFMKAFKTEHNVRNPIVQTNIIRKNPKYHHCYEVYRYIESYSGLGIDYHMSEDYSVLSEEELGDINYSLLGTYLSLHNRPRSNEYKRRSKSYKPKILTSSDDESFVYGPYLEGPIEFVRIDEGYQRYLESMVPQDLPLHPNRKVKEYYAELYQRKRDFVEWQKQRESLIKRKQKELKYFEMEVQETLAKREDERLRLLELEKALVEREQEATLNKIRKEIIEAALAERMMDTPASKPFNPDDHIGPLFGEGEAIPKREEYPIDKSDTVLAPENTDFAPFLHTGVGALEAYYNGTLVKDDKRIDRNGKPVRYVVRKIRKDQHKDGHLLAPLPSFIDETNKEEIVLTDAGQDGGRKIRFIVQNDKKKEKINAKRGDINIEGEFIVMCPRGYYVDDYKYSPDKNAAMVFPSFDDAYRIKLRFGGKVVML